MKNPTNPVELKRFLIENGLTDNRVICDTESVHPATPMPKIVCVSDAHLGSRHPSWGKWSRRQMKEL